MAAALPPVAATIVKLGEGGAYGREQGSCRPLLSSRRRTLEALEQDFKRERSKEILHLLKEALQLLDRQSFDTDPQSYAVLLKGCTDADSLLAGQFIHQHIFTNGYEHHTYICNFLVEMYGKCGALDEARFIFDWMDQPNVFSWTIIIAAYVHHGSFEEAYKLFLQMRQKGAKPNKFTFSTILGTCSRPAAIARGENIHASAVQDGFDSDVVVGTALVNMYGKCRRVIDAGLVFQKIRQRDVVAWNAMIAVFVEHGEGKAALELFNQMLLDGMEPNRMTFASILGACGSQDCLQQGEMIHAKIVGFGFLSDLVIMNALIDMYGKCGSLCSARAVFDKLYRRDVVSWTAIIVVYAQHPREALELFKQMLVASFMPNEFTYASILTVCGNLKALGQGQLAHHCIMEAGLESNMVVATALIGMYGKCVNLKDASWVFNQVPVRDLVLWNALIAMYAQHDLGKEALNSLRQMQQEGHTPDEITFTSVLSACGHTGLVDEGRRIYSSMGKDFNVMPSVEHCGCMVDLFGRAAMLQEAEDFIESMPLKPNTVVWEIFLNACRLYADRGGVQSAKKAIKDLARKGAAP
eukprot:c19311_g1_i1 orf=130-1872(+)